MSTQECGPEPPYTWEVDISDEGRHAMHLLTVQGMGSATLLRRPDEPQTIEIMHITTLDPRDTSNDAARAKLFGAVVEICAAQKDNNGNPTYEIAELITTSGAEATLLQYLDLDRVSLMPTDEDPRGLDLTVEDIVSDFDAAISGLPLDAWGMQPTSVVARIALEAT